MLQALHTRFKAHCEFQRIQESYNQIQKAFLLESNLNIALSKLYTQIFRIKWIAINPNPFNL